MWIYYSCIESGYTAKKCGYTNYVCQQIVKPWLDYRIDYRMDYRIDYRIDYGIDWSVNCRID